MIIIYILYEKSEELKKIKFIDNELYKFIKIIIKINNGKEANNVYINK